MTKRNAHALQRRYTKLLAIATAVTSARWQFGQGVTGGPPCSLGRGMLGVLRLVFARGLRLFGKWRDVVDQLRVALVHAPDVPARAAIVRDSRELARERQIPGGILPARRTGRSLEQVIVSRTERASSATSGLRHVSRRLDSFVSPKSWDAIPFVSLGGLQTVPPGELTSLRLGGSPLLP